VLATRAAFFLKVHESPEFPFHVCLVCRECAKKLFLRFYSSKETNLPAPSLAPCGRRTAAHPSDDETTKEVGTSISVVSEDAEAEARAERDAAAKENSLEALADEFVAHLQCYTHSMATLQGILMKFRHSPHAAAAHASSLSAAAKQNGGDATTAAAELIPLTSSSMK